MAAQIDTAALVKAQTVFDEAMLGLTPDLQDIYRGLTDLSERIGVIAEERDVLQQQVYDLQQKVMSYEERFGPLTVS